MQVGAVVPARQEAPGVSNSLEGPWVTQPHTTTPPKAYHRMELLSQSIRNELQRDLHIHDSAVLPNFVNLPQVCTGHHAVCHAIIQGYMQVMLPNNKLMSSVSLSIPYISVMHYWSAM